MFVTGLFCCAEFDICNKLYHCLAGLVTVTKCTFACPKQNHGEVSNSRKLPMILGSFEIFFHVLLISEKPEQVFSCCFYVGVVFDSMVK